MRSASVIGLGYIGLPTAILLAKHNIHVHGVDVQQSVVDKINAAQAHIVEHGLQALLEDAVHSGHLHADTHVRAADAFIITVPTPIDIEHRPDISYIKAAAEAIAPVLEQGNLIILESTSPVGTTEKLEQWLAALRPDLTFPYLADEAADIQLAYCPERVLPGNTVHELVHNDRIIGGLTNVASRKAKELYEVFVQGCLYTTHTRTAELVKLAENAFRDVNIAFANEIDRICHTLAIDSAELIDLANKHPRVNILQPGCGVGGHCIPVDPWFIVDSVPQEAQLIHCARRVNDQRPQWVTEQIKEKIWHILTMNTQRNIEKAIVACLGVSYKADSDDLRNSPAVQIIQNVAKLGCQVLVVSPYIQELPFAADNIHYSELDAALDVADVVCVLVKDAAFVEAKERIDKHRHVVDMVGILKK